VNITVLLGGYSAERDVSLASGLRIAEALRTAGHTVTCVDPAEGALTRAREEAHLAAGVGSTPPSLEQLGRLGDGVGSIAPALAEWPEVRGADVVFLALHGGQGEDGTVQALLDLAGVRYTGSGHLGSALAMDKHLSKVLFRAADVGTADWLMAPHPDGATAKSRAHFAEEVERTLGLPVVVKPSKQGSTVGLAVVKEIGQLDAALALAFRYDDEVMVEQFVAGRELTVGVLGDRALPVLEIIPKNEIYDYEAKYTPGMAEERVAELGDGTRARLEEQALRAFRALKLRGCARIDFRMDELGNVYCLEANTLPGMTRLSLVPQAAEAAGLLFPALCERIVALAARGGTGSAG
jgi:D-alanine-D-alanine ligase